MKTRLILISIFNIFDIIATIVTTNNGFVEANPAMAALLQNPAIFAIVKFAITSIVMCWLWCNREHKNAKIASWIVFIMYGLLSLYYAVVFFIWI